jgi:RNA polymerase sigma factor (sigma-70 family)
LAQDCAQRALIRIHQQRRRCEEPKAFRTWSLRIVSNLTIDELRRRKRLQPLPAPAQEAQLDTEAAPNPELEIADSLTAVSLRRLLQTSPMSDRSRRVVIGRYLDDLDDNVLAQTESELAGEDIRPSHIQVTRSKNISKLRQWPLLKRFLEEAG